MANNVGNSDQIARGEKKSQKSLIWKHSKLQDRRCK